MKSNIIEIALKEYGIHEISGGVHNPRILEYFKASGNDWVKDDETAWCSAFINYVVKTAGYAITKNLLAMSWLDAGQPTENPEIGDVVVFKRVGDRSAHVSLFIRDDGTNIWCLGGNQSDGVNISPYDKSRVACIS